MTTFLKENKNAIYGGIVATIFSGLGVFLLGNRNRQIIIHNPIYYWLSLLYH